MYSIARTSSTASNIRLGAGADVDADVDAATSALSQGDLAIMESNTAKNTIKRHFLFYRAAAAFYKFKNNLNLDRTGTPSAWRGTPIS